MADEAAKWSGAPEEYDIVFVLPHLGPGGAQRVASHLANAWSNEGRRVCVITTHSTPQDAYKLDPAIRRMGLVLPGTGVDLSFLRKVVLHIRSRLRTVWRGVVARIAPDTLGIPGRTIGRV